MLLSGVQKITLVDYPGKTACIVFLPGCGFRCKYCHNPQFVLPEQISAIVDSFIPLEPFFKFLDSRKGKLDGVSICWGEPTIHKELPDFIKRIKERGFLVKLDSNGSHPEVISALVKSRSVDYFAIDIKQTREKYTILCGEKVNPEKTFETAKIVIDSGIDHEFRTTVAEGEHTEEDIEKIAASITGAKRYFLQNFRNPGAILNPAFHGHPMTQKKLERLVEVARKYIREVRIRE